MGSALKSNMPHSWCLLSYTTAVLKDAAVKTRKGGTLLVIPFGYYEFENRNTDLDV